MKISGFTIVRNAIKYDYPIVESITSILPLCDEMIVLVGKSDDDTLQLIRAINSEKIKIYESVWDDTLREGGRVLAIETDKALKHISADADWCFYIQADEVLHEQYHDEIKTACEKYKDQREVEGLVFNYVHFYGSYDYVAVSRKWYQNEIRIIRNDKNIFSYRDAQGFRTLPNRKLNCKKINASIFHYGWVKHPKYQQAKQESFHKMWHEDKWLDKNVLKTNEFDYTNIDKLEKFKGTHPITMQDRVNNQNWKFDFDLSIDTTKPKYKFLNGLEKLTGTSIARYQNYKLI